MRVLIAFMMLTLVLAACDDTDNNGDADSGVSGSGDGSATVQSDDQTLATRSDDEAGQNVEAYSVADAGGVEFEFDGEQLRLVQAYPNSGWSHTVEVADDDQIEVDFHEDGRDVEFEAEIENGRLVLEVIDNYRDVDEQSFTVAGAGVVELLLENDELSLDEVNPNDDWTSTVDDDNDRGIIVEFRRQDDDTAGIRFEAELDGSELEVTIVTREYR